jgi:hypothetical protein
MAYMLSANMDRGAPEFQIEAAISKVFASVIQTYVFFFRVLFNLAANVDDYCSVLGSLLVGC